MPLLTADDLRQSALITFEMQRGVVGDLHTMPVIFEAVRESNLIAEIKRLVDPMRSAGVPVIHATVARRPDRRGTYANMPYVSAHLGDAAKRDVLEVGAPGTDVVPDLFHPDDIVVQRLHGVSGFTDTGLDSMLRSMERRNLVITGSSVNRGVIGMTIEAINRGYQVVIPREAVCGYPLEYRDMMLEHSLRQITTLCAIDELLELL